MEIHEVNIEMPQKIGEGPGMSVDDLKYNTPANQFPPLPRKTMF
jgi:hypothetical protein